MPTESQAPGQGASLRAYLDAFITPLVTRLGFEAPRIFDNPNGVHGPFLIAERHEGASLPTILIYGHGDTVRGYPEQWREGLSPGRSWSKATAGTGAAPPTTRASTSSTSRPWNR